MMKTYIHKLYDVNLLIVIVLLLSLSSCMLGPNYQRAKYDGPEAFRFDTSLTTQSVNLRWWELFDEPELDTLIVTALNNNKDVIIAAARVESARINMGYVKAEQWPSFFYSVGLSGKGLSNNNSGSFNAYPQLSWEIGFWGKYRRMNEAAQADYLSTEYAQRTVQIGLVSAVASTYYSILAAEEQLSIAKKTLSSRDSAIIIMYDKYDGGMISLMDYNQAKIQRDIAAVAVPAYKRIVALSENALNILLGNAPVNNYFTTKFGTCRYELDIPVGLPSELLERRPDILMSEQVLHAQLANIGVAEALRWPSLSLTGLLGASADLAAFNTMGVSWSAGASLLGPIFQFGQNKKRVEIAKQTALMAQTDYEKTIINAFRETEDALVSINTYRDELKAQESRAETAISSEILSYIRYNEGSTTYLEVLEQQRQSFSAQLDLSNTKLNLLNSYILLYKALGGGWLSAQEEEQFNKNTNQ
jgi:multidrug efflux system outer membrane protein